MRPHERNLMDVFAFREELIAEYARFSRSFTRIRADDISHEVDASYHAGRFLLAPLTTIVRSAPEVA